MSLEKFAIVGATDNPSKYGNEILHDLRNRGYDVYPINPRLGEIDGVKCYPSLSALPVEVDVLLLATSAMSPIFVRLAAFLEKNI